MDTTKQRGKERDKKKALFRSLLLRRNIRSISYVVLDAIGLETDFTLETNRKRMKEKLLKRIKTTKFHLSDLKFQIIMKSEMEKKKKTCILYSPSILKHILSV